MDDCLADKKSEERITRTDSMSYWCHQLGGYGSASGDREISGVQGSGIGFDHPGVRIPKLGPDRPGDDSGSGMLETARDTENGCFSVFGDFWPRGSKNGVLARKPEKCSKSVKNCPETRKRS